MRWAGWPGWAPAFLAVGDLTMGLRACGGFAEGGTEEVVALVPGRARGGPELGLQVSDASLHLGGVPLERADPPVALQASGTRDGSHPVSIAPRRPSSCAAFPGERLRSQYLPLRILLRL